MNFYFFSDLSPNILTFNSCAASVENNPRSFKTFIILLKVSTFFSRRLSFCLNILASELCFSKYLVITLRSLGFLKSSGLKSPRTFTVRFLVDWISSLEVHFRFLKFFCVRNNKRNKCQSISPFNVYTNLLNGWQVLRSLSNGSSGNVSWEK